MGLEILSPDPEFWRRKIHELAGSHEDAARRRILAERVSMFRDGIDDVLLNLIRQVFQDGAIQLVISRLIPAVGGSSFLKKVACELARPLYARAALRRVLQRERPRPDIAPPPPDEWEPQPPDDAQEAFDALSREIGLDGRMDDAARLLVAANAVFVMPRFVEDLGRVCLDVLTGDQLCVVPHPEMPTWALAIAYDRPSRTTPKAIERCVWDDKRYFVLDGATGLFLAEPVEHGLGLLPIVDVHVKGRTSSYWDLTTGSDLVRQTKNSLLFDLVVAKKVQVQSHLQLAATGALDGVPKNQVLDELSILCGEGNVNLSVLNLESDPSKVVATRESNEKRVEAHYGLGDDDEAGNVRVSELATILVDAEGRLFEVLKAIAKQAPAYVGRLPADARLVVDLGQIHNRVDRKTQLEIRQSERSMGLRSGIDDVLEDNPEFKGDRPLAMDYVDQRMREEAVIVTRRRALNMPAAGNTPQAPGQSPQMNGASGPLVRDGLMSRDAAAKAAAQGPAPDLLALARRTLGAAA